MVSVSASEIKFYLPSIDLVASELYGIEFGRDHRALCPKHRDHSPSLYHDRGKDRVFCVSHQCFGEKGVDAFGLVQCMEGLDFPAACQRLAEVYAPHLLSSYDRVETPPRPNRQSRSSAEAPVIASDTRTRMERDGWRVVAEYPFGPNLRKVRYQHGADRQQKGKPKKTCVWEHLKEGVWHTTKGGRKNPVYLNRIARERDQLESAIGFEGENKAEAAGELGYPAFSIKDLTDENAAQLAGLDITIWRDKDRDGQKIQSTAIRLLKLHARSIRVVDPMLLEDLPVAGDIIDAIAAGYDADRIAGVLKGATLIDDHIPPGQVRPKVLALDDIMKLKIKTTETLIEEIVPTPGCTLVVGREKTGKTLLAMQMGMSIASGTALFQNFRITNPGGVLVVEVDDPSGAASVRLLLEKTDLAIKGAPFFVVEGAGLTLSEEFLEWLRTEIRTRGIRTVILDSYTTLRPGRKPGGDLVKTESTEMAMLDCLAKETDCVIFLIHHESKGGSGLDWSARAAGTFAITAAVEAIISISRFQDLEGNAPERWVRIRGRHIQDRELVLKLRPEFLNFELVLDNIVAGLFPQVKLLKAAFGDRTFSPKDAEKETGISRSGVFRLLSRLTGAGILRKDGRGDYRLESSA